MISYQPLNVTLAKHNLKKLEFRDKVGISNGTLAKIGKNQSITLEIIERICLKLDCQIEEVVKITKE